MRIMVENGPHLAAAFTHTHHSVKFFFGDAYGRDKRVWYVFLELPGEERPIAQRVPINRAVLVPTPQDSGADS